MRDGLAAVGIEEMQIGSGNAQGHVAAGFLRHTIMRHGNQLDFRTTVIACAVASTCMLLFCALARNQAIKTS